MTIECRKRFSQVYDILIEKGSKNPNIQYIVLSHGASIMSQQNVLSKYTFPTFCGVNLLKSTGKNKEGQSTYEPIIFNHYGYDRSIVKNVPKPYEQERINEIDPD